MSTDSFAALADSVSEPSRLPFAITPHDTNALTLVPKALYVGVGGTIVLRGIDAGSDVTFRNVASGQVLDVRASHVRVTGTTATDIIGLA